MKPLAVGLASVAAIGLGAAALVAVPHESTIGAYATTLTGRTNNQRHNAHLALSRLTQATIPAGATFSFNQRVGSFSRDRGFRKAPVSYNGQLINDWGGGVCQTSTTLYNAALLGGMEILERHHHRFAPSYVPAGRDAAVAFSGIDLRFRNPYPFPVRVIGEVTGDQLKVAIVGVGNVPVRPQVTSHVRETLTPATFVLGEANGRRRTRNSGKTGFDVTVIREIGNRKEVISRDTYPAMNRVIQIDP